MKFTPRSGYQNSQRGGALVESLLICGVLVIFMIGIPMMGSIVDLKQKTIEASRYAAWEKTVQDPNQPQADQIDVRFFKNESAPISSIRPGDDLVGENLLWGAQELNQETSTAPGSEEGAGGEGNMELYQRARITANVDNINVSKQTAANGDDMGLDGLTGDVYTNISEAATLVGSFLSPDAWRGENNIEIDGLMRLHVEVQVESNEFLNSSNTINESTAILADGWSAADPDVIRDRVHGFVPTEKLDQVGRLISKLKVIPMLKDLKHLEDAFGCVKLGVRPAKELEIGNLPRYTEGPGDNC